MSLNALSAVAVTKRDWGTCVEIPAVDSLPFFAAAYYAPIHSRSACQVATNRRMQSLNERAVVAVGASGSGKAASVCIGVLLKCPGLF